MSADMNGHAQRQGDCKGIIVIDGSVLTSLATSYNNTNTNSVEAYLDILTLLKQRGFRIILPETVAYEMDLGFRFNPDDYFRPSNAGNNTDGLNKQINRETAAIVRKWIKHANIEIARVDLSKEALPVYAAYCNEAHQLNQLHSVIGGSTKGMSKRIQDFHALPHEHFGTTHCADVVASCIKQPKTSATPVFLLTEYKDINSILFDRLKQVNGKAGVLHTHGLIGALMHEKAPSGRSVLELMGVPGTHYEIAKAIEKNKLRKPNYRGDKTHLHHIADGSFHMGMVDKDALTGAPGPFAQAVHGLAADMDRERVVEPETSAGLSEARIAALQKRFPGFKANGNSNAETQGRSLK